MRIIFIFLCAFVLGFAPILAEQNSVKNELKGNFMNNKIEQKKIFLNINGAKLNVALAQNSSAVALYELLSKGEITINAKDYGGFEKSGKLPKELVRNDEQITMEPGDIVLYAGQTFVIAYGRNSWSLTRLGRIENINENELKKLLGAGEVEIKLSIK